jgi:lipopolysaccharide exporter
MLFGFINFIILIRVLPKPEMGVWAFFLVITTLIESTKSNLLKNAHIKFVGNYNDEKTAIASSSLLLNTTISLLFILFLFLFSGALSSWLNTGGELENMLKWFTPGLVAMIFFSHFEALSQSHLDFKAVFAGYFTRQVLFFAIILSHQLLKVPFSLVQLAIYQSISIAFGTIALYVFSRKHLLYRFNPSMHWIKKLLGFGGYIFGSGILSNLFANLDQIMIAKFTTSNSMVANYNAALRINALVDVPSYAAAEILLPKVSQIDVKEGPDRVKYMYERIVGILLSFTVPIALFIILFPKLIITIIAGEQYVDAAFILQMYMIAGIIRPVQNQAANILLYIGKARLCFILNTFYLIVNFSINYLCLKQFGFYGAAIGNVTTCVLGTVVWWLILQKSIGIEFSAVWKYISNTYKTIFGQAALVIAKMKQVRV